MTETTAPALPADPIAAAAYEWLESQPDGEVRIAREILRRRKALRSPGRARDEWHAVHESGVIDGMRRALAELGDRPGDLSQTGAEGFISAVEAADRMVAEAAAREDAR